MLARLVLKNLIYKSSSMIIANLIGLITVIYLARALKPELFGLYSLSLSIVGILSIFSDLGINSAATRYIADAMKSSDKKLAGGYARFLLNLKLFLSVSIALALFVLSESISSAFDKPISTLLMLLSIYLVFSSISSLFLGMANAMNDFKADLLNNSISGFSKLLITILLVFLGFSLLGAVTAVVVSAVIAFFAILYYILKKYRFLLADHARIDHRRIWRFIAFTALISIPAVIFVNVDVVMLGYFLQAEEVAYYRAGFSIVSAVISVLSIPAVLMPVFVKLEGEDLNRAFTRAFKYSSALCIPSALGLMLISKNLLLLAYGEDYIPGLTAMQILCLLLIHPVFGIYGSIFSAKEKPELYFYPLIFSAILNVILNYLAIPIFGIVGAAVATVASNVALWAMLAFICLKEFDLYPKTSHIAKPFFCAILMSLVARNFDSMLIIIPSSILIYSFAMLALKGITKEDIDFIRKIGGV